MRSPHLCVARAQQNAFRSPDNGGYAQFFTNSSVEYVPHIVDALNRIGCPETSKLTRRATTVAIGEGAATAASITAAMESANATRDAALSEIDGAYFASGEDIADALFRRLLLRHADIAFVESTAG